MPARVAPRLRTASPAEADGSFFREGPVPSVGNSTEGCERRSGNGGEREGVMTMLLSLAMVFGTLLCCLAQFQQLRKVIASQRPAGLNRPRVR